MNSLLFHLIRRERKSVVILLIGSLLIFEYVFLSDSIFSTFKI